METNFPAHVNPKEWVANAEQFEEHVKACSPAVQARWADLKAARSEVRPINEWLATRRDQFVTCGNLQDMVAGMREERYAEVQFWLQYAYEMGRSHAAP